MTSTLQRASEAKAAERAGEAAKITPLDAAKQAIARNMPTFKAVLPAGWDKDRFQNLVLTAVKREPKLVRCFTTPQGQMSLIVAAIQCATVGLEPNTPLKEASLVPRRNKGVDECQLMIEYRGLLKLARRSGEISSFEADVVYERDEFVHKKGLEPVLDHVPYDGDDDPGELRYAYCIVRFKDGGVQTKVLSRREVHKRRAKSDSWARESSRPYSPWTTAPESMWMKSAVRAIEPFLPLTAEARLGFDSDDRRFVIDGGSVMAADELPALSEGGDPIDPETGQIGDDVIDADIVETPDGALPGVS